MKNSMKLALVAMTVLTFAGCKKKQEEAPAPVVASKTTETKRVEPAPAAPAAPTETKPEFDAMGIPECVAVLETHKKFQACTKIKDEDRAVQDVNVSMLGEILAAGKASDPEIAKTAAVSNCKDQNAKLAQLITAAGC